MAQVSLYYRTQLETKVSLLAEQVDANMDDHLLNNLRNKIEKKAIDSGIVLRITKIINYKHGIIDKINFMGTTVYSVLYECFICSPVKDLEIICVVRNIIKGYIIASNGPIMIAIQFNNIDNTIFEINNDDIQVKMDIKKKIQKDDYLKVSIININNNLGQENILVICKLINLATPDEIDMYKRDQKMVVDGTNDDDNEFI